MIIIEVEYFNVHVKYRKPILLFDSGYVGIQRLTVSNIVVIKVVYFLISSKVCFEVGF